MNILLVFLNVFACNLWNVDDNRVQACKDMSIIKQGNSLIMTKKLKPMECTTIDANSSLQLVDKKLIVHYNSDNCNGANKVIVRHGKVQLFNNLYLMLIDKDVLQVIK